MITHEEVRRLMQVLENDDIYEKDLLVIHKVIATYITQQEKQEKLLELYKRLTNLYEKLYDTELSHYYEIKIIKIKQQIKELENELD